MKKLRFIVGACVALANSLVIAPAQAESLTVHVRDQNGADIPGSQVHTRGRSLPPPRRHLFGGLGRAECESVGVVRIAHLLEELGAGQSVDVGREVVRVDFLEALLALGPLRGISEPP